jgi:teichuronic acid biosynthesis glycosyltransferase TuaG
MLSIIIPVFNAEKTLSRTLDSLLNQTYKSIEILVINDFSNDGTSNIIEEYALNNNCIKVINLTKNYGACYARNIGIKNARGNFISFIDADDYWHLTKAKSQIDFMIEGNLHFTYTDYSYIRNSHILNSVSCPHKYNIWQLMKNTSICLSTVMYSVDICGKIYFNDVRPATELHLYLRLFSYGSGNKLNMNLCFYNLSPSSMSGNKFRAAKIAYSKYKNYLGMEGILFHLLFLHYILNATGRHLLAKILYLIKK